jgi:hypothetical protein
MAANASSGPSILQNGEGGKRATGIEPATFSLGSGGHRTEVLQNTALTAHDADACTNACTEAAESVHSDAADRGFIEALAMVARLPLSDAERAEAVRRLLAGAEGGGR